MVSRLAQKQKKLIEKKIKKEFAFRQRLQRRKEAGVKLTQKQSRQLARSNRQVVAMGFEEAWKEDESIPQLDKRTGQTE